VQRQGEDAGVDAGFTDGLVGGVQLGSYRQLDVALMKEWWENR
jgi:hypothetical protein